MFYMHFKKFIVIGCGVLYMSKLLIVVQIFYILSRLVAQSMWDLPGSGIEAVSPEVAGGFFTMEISGKPHSFFITKIAVCARILQ